MNDNLRIWNQLDTPPPSSLKPIIGGRLKGMTDINPQWRMQAMTEVFGPCGFGWRYTIDRLWTEPGHGDEVLAFATISVSVKRGESWSEPIPGIGGNKLVESEKRGPHNNDEAYKMAVTDALSVALKSLGVAAKIYGGQWDGSKYNMRPEDVVTLQQLNSLKLKYATQHEAELEGLDQPAKKQRFVAWCSEIIGKEADWSDPESWDQEWYQTAWKYLSGASSDVPFEE